MMNRTLEIIQEYGLLSIVCTASAFVGAGLFGGVCHRPFVSVFSRSALLQQHIAAESGNAVHEKR